MCIYIFFFWGGVDMHVINKDLLVQICLCICAGLKDTGCTFYGFSVKLLCILKLLPDFCVISWLAITSKNTHYPSWWWCKNKFCEIAVHIFRVGPLSIYLYLVIFLWLQVIMMGDCRVPMAQIYLSHIYCSWLHPTLRCHKSTLHLHKWWCITVPIWDQS